MTLAFELKTEEQDLKLSFLYKNSQPFTIEIEPKIMNRIRSQIPKADIRIIQVPNKFRALNLRRFRPQSDLGSQLGVC